MLDSWVKRLEELRREQSKPLEIYIRVEIHPPLIDSDKETGKNEEDTIVDFSI